MKSKDPAGACPRCRKEIPLVPDGQGDLVLEVHHVVAIEGKYGVPDVAVCPGTGSAAASLDDGEDWAWVKPDPQWVRDDSSVRPTRVTPERIGNSLRAAQDAMRAFSAAVSATLASADDDGTCNAWVGLCQCRNTPCDGAHRCSCGHSWAAREYANGMRPADGVG